MLVTKPLVIQQYLYRASMPKGLHNAAIVIRTTGISCTSTGHFAQAWNICTSNMPNTAVFHNHGYVAMVVDAFNLLYPQVLQAWQLKLFPDQLPYHSLTRKGQAKLVHGIKDTRSNYPLLLYISFAKQSSITVQCSRAADTAHLYCSEPDVQGRGWIGNTFVTT